MYLSRIFLFIGVFWIDPEKRMGSIQKPVENQKLGIANKNGSIQNYYRVKNSFVIQFRML